MKKYIRFTLIFLLILVIGSGCSVNTKAREKDNYANNMTKTGIEPYLSSEKEHSLLRNLALNDRVTIVNYNAPEGAKQLSVLRNELKEDGSWSVEHLGSISIHEADGMKLNGSIAVIFQDNHDLEIIINNENSQGKYFVESKLSEEDRFEKIVSKNSLGEFKEITLDEDIPILMIVMNEGEIVGPELSYYENAEKLKDMELVQAIVLQFK